MVNRSLTLQPSVNSVNELWSIGRKRTFRFLNRDYKNAHHDVTVLESAGMLVVRWSRAFGALGGVKRQYPAVSPVRIDDALIARIVCKLIEFLPPEPLI